MKFKIKVGVLLALSASLTVWAGDSPVGAGAKPNVVIIVADDLGYSDLSYQGCPDIPTPQIDSIARNGVSFCNAYVSAPVCLPSRMGLITGRYQQRFGIQTLGNDEIGIPATEITLPEMLRANGYATAAIGKWHMGTLPEFQPDTRGIDAFYGFLGGSIAYLPDDGKGMQRNRVEVTKPAYTTDAFGDEAVSFINRQGRQPFLLYLAFNAVHVPMEAIAKYQDRFPDIKDRGRRIYAAMTSALDDNVGRVLAALRANHLEENTLIFFLSDNGGAPQNWSDNRPLRAGKYELYEGGIRTPFLFQWKTGGIPAGDERKALISSLDIVPTVLAAINGTVEPKNAFDGVNLLPFLRGKESGLPRERLFWRYGPYMCAMREGDWKIIKSGMGENKNPVWELYNISGDISEKNNLADAHPEKLSQLAAVFEAWDKTLPPPIVIDQRLLDGKIWWRKRGALPGGTKMARDISDAQKSMP